MVVFCQKLLLNLFEFITKPLAYCTLIKQLHKLVTALLKSFKIFAKSAVIKFTNFLVYCITALKGFIYSSTCTCLTSRLGCVPYDHAMWAKKCL